MKGSLLEKPKNEWEWLKKLRRSKTKERRLKTKIEGMDKLPTQLWFITLTLNAKRGKDREKKETIKTAVKNALRPMKKEAYYTYVIERHKKGGVHAHMMADTLTMLTINERYKAGFTNLQPIYGNVKNELQKYLMKQDRGEQKAVSSRKLTKTINDQKLVERKNKHYDCNIEEINL